MPRGIHKIENHYRATGTLHGRSKLTELQVLMIRQLANIMSMQDIADRYTISKTQVFNIVHKRNWTHI